MSKENRTQIQSFLDDILGTLLGDIATSRALGKKELDKHADDLAGGNAQKAMAAALID